MMRECLSLLHVFKEVENQTKEMQEEQFHLQMRQDKKIGREGGEGTYPSPAVLADAALTHSLLQWRCLPQLWYPLPLLGLVLPPGLLLFLGSSV